MYRECVVNAQFLSHFIKKFNAHSKFFGCYNKSNLTFPIHLYIPLMYITNTKASSYATNENTEIPGNKKFNTTLHFSNI